MTAVVVACLAFAISNVHRLLQLYGVCFAQQCAIYSMELCGLSPNSKTRLDCCCRVGVKQPARTDRSHTHLSSSMTTRQTLSDAQQERLAHGVVALYAVPLLLVICSGMMIWNKRTARNENIDACSLFFCRWDFTGQEARISIQHRLSIHMCMLLLSAPIIATLSLDQSSAGTAVDTIQQQFYLSFLTPSLNMHTICIQNRFGDKKNKMKIQAGGGLKAALHEQSNL